MVSNTSRDLRKELDKTNISSLVEMRRLLEKLLDRMIELEDMIVEKADIIYESDSH